MSVCVCVDNLASGSLVIMWMRDMIPTATGAAVVMPTATTMTVVPQSLAGRSSKQVSMCHWWEQKDHGADIFEGNEIDHR